MHFRRFSHLYKGHHIEGDLQMPPTLWWNRWFLRRFWWKKLVIFAVPEGSEYTVSCRNFLGELYQLEWRPRDDPRFAVFVGRENCTFIALDKKGREIPLDVIKIGTINDIDVETPIL